MATVTLKAHYDGKHIVLDEPFELPAHAPLAVTVLAQGDLHPASDRVEWAALTARGLAGAYGDDEPEYTVDDLKP